MAADDAENRFKQLLQPIRDLAANWDVDIATALEGYLGDLDAITIELQDGSTNLNFAQAALLIQGSTCVYSKKVEYLHALVYQTLELITAQKRAGTKGKNSEHEVHEEEIVWDADPKMLILDDVVEEGQDIDLVLTSKERQNRRSSYTMGRSRASNSTDITRASMVLMHSILQEDHGNFSLKVNSCSLDDNGALVLPGTMSAAKRRNSENFYPPQNANNFDDGDDGDDGPMDVYGPVFDDSTDYTAAPDGAQPAGGMFMDSNMQPMHTSTPKKGISFADDVEAHDAHEEEPDPWAPLDPHSTDNIKPRPARKGRTFKLPASLKQNKSSQGSNDQNDLVDVAAMESMMNRHKMGYEGIKLKGALFPEFGHYLKHLRKRQLQQRIKRSKERDAAGRGSGATQQAQAKVQDNNADHFDDGDDGDMYFGGDDGDFDDDDLGALGGGLEDLGGTDMGGHDEEVTNAFTDAFKEASQTYEDLCKRHIENFMQGVDKYARETQLTKRVADWQEKLEPLLEEQENRDPFDIHVYGDKIINKLGKAKKRHSENVEVEFSEVAGKSSQFEVCRLFLASLQLANTGNLELSHTSGDDQHLQMRLTTATKGVDIDKYLAPSLVEGTC